MAFQVTRTSDKASSIRKKRGKIAGFRLQVGQTPGASF
jgi:hypothetical protein